MTTRQTQVLELLKNEPVIGPRRVAGALDMRAQDAGRVLAGLERAGLVEFVVTAKRAGYRIECEHKWVTAITGERFCTICKLCEC